MPGSMDHAIAKTVLSTAGEADKARVISSNSAYPPLSKNTTLGVQCKQPGRGYPLL